MEGGGWVRTEFSKKNLIQNSKVGNAPSAIPGYKHPHFLACPGDLYYFVQPNTDNREIYTRLKASNVNDCVRKCYADDFCFSALFTPKQAPEEADCLLSYISGFNCTRKRLTSTYSDNSQAAVLECLRCPQNGEFGMCSAIMNA